MAIATSPLIARPGWIFIAIATLLAWGVHYFAGDLYAIPFWALVVFLLFLFRDPEREITSQPLAIVSPVDGCIVAIENTHDIFLERKAIRVTIKMNFFGSYVVRSPTEGKVRQRWFSTPVKTREMTGPREQDAISAWIQTDEADDIVLSMSRSSIVAAPNYNIQSGERIGHGQRCGFVRFGTTVEVYLPDNSRILVENGDKVHSGSDTLALLVHK